MVCIFAALGVSGPIRSAGLPEDYTEMIWGHSCKFRGVRVRGFSFLTVHWFGLGLTN